MDYDGWGKAPASTGMKPAEKPDTARSIVMLQRSSAKGGSRLGKTTGWIHRAAMKKHGVEIVPDVTYVRVDDAGLHVLVAGQPRVLDVDTVVVCAGQVSRSELAAPLKAAGLAVHVIGGAEEASELDAKRAIAQGARVAAGL